MLEGDKNLRNFVNKLGSTLDNDGLDDIGDQLNELKGILSESLGDFPFKCAIIVVVLFNLLYTFYGGYFAARTDNAIESDCYCDPGDKIFYRTLMLVFTISWVCILFLDVNDLFLTMKQNMTIIKKK